MRRRKAVSCAAATRSGVGVQSGPSRHVSLVIAACPILDVHRTAPGTSETSADAVPAPDAVPGADAVGRRHAVRRPHAAPAPHAVLGPSHRLMPASRAY